MPALVPPVLHPLVVHFVVVLIPLAAILATFAAAKPTTWARHFLLIVLVVAAIAAFTANQLGDSDLHKARHSLTPAVRAVAHIHQTLGNLTWMSTAALAAGAVLFRRKLATGPWMWVLAGLLWALVALLVMTAWYGGALTYEYGVNTP